MYSNPQQLVTSIDFRMIDKHAAVKNPLIGAENAP